MSAELTPQLQELAGLYGIETGYANVWGEHHDAPPETLIAILKTLGANPNAPNAIEKAHDRVWQRPIEPAFVVPVGECPVRVMVRVPVDGAPKTLNWRLREESGTQHTGKIELSDCPVSDEKTLCNGTAMKALEWVLPETPPMGYHLLTLKVGKQAFAETAIIIVPDTCYLPPFFKHDDDPEAAAGRVWGPATQLYAMRSRRNWGMGDYTDLKNVMSWCADHGSGIVGVNPLHELFPHHAEHISPYSPSTRSFFNTLYLDVEEIAQYEGCMQIRDQLASPAHRETLDRLQEPNYVAYKAVADHKRPMFRQLYDAFASVHLKKNTRQAKTYHAFVEQQSPMLDKVCTFQALQAHFCADDLSKWSFTEWPQAYQSPDTQAVAQFKTDHSDEVAYHQYLQWHADRQLQQVKAVAVERKMPVGLYMDLAVGCDGSGADVWLNQSLYASNMEVGAPPDECNQKGQCWGLPPYIPAKLRDIAYAPFIQTLRNNMHHAGALRLDHVMGLMRLFWSPKGRDATHGAYVRYPFEEMLGILALESHRNHCMVIGEDLGTVPDIVRDRMEKWQILSYKLFIFERNSVSYYKRPDAYPTRSLVSLSTHDLPTLSGLWESEDIRIRNALDLFPNEAFRERQIKDRVLERAGILDALHETNLLPFEYHDYKLESLPPMSPSLALAVHEYLSRTSSYVHMVQLEDVFGQRKQINLPGTVDQYPNWQRKVTVPLEDWSTHPYMRPLLDNFRVAYGLFAEPLTV